MKIINTSELETTRLSRHEEDWIYNGLDCCITAEVLKRLEEQLDDTTRRTYDFSRALQGPALEMRLRGVRIDQHRRQEVIDEYHERLDKLESDLERIVREGLGFFGFNWRSNADLQHVFYSLLGIPPIRKRGGGGPTVDRSALERLDLYNIAKPIVAHILAMRELGKRIGMLKTGIDPDGRMRTSYNIAGTTTGRWSSSFSEFGTGTNLQNIEEALRTIFVADRGMKLAYADAQQGESRVVGAIEWNLFRDDTYLSACEAGDLHTDVVRLCWPELPWTGELGYDRALAEKPYYRHYSRRFMCKKLGHGSNYMGKPPTLSLQSKVPLPVVADFQAKYFAAFPAHPRWHEWIRECLRGKGFLVSLTGRRRWFFGRRDDDKTLREAIAYDPQGSLGDILNGGLLNLWRTRRVQLLMQVHDAVLFQYPENEEAEAIPFALSSLQYPINLKHNRQLVIPYDCATGWNWGKYSAGNPDGLKPWTGTGDKRRRSAEVSILDRPVHRVHRGTW